MRDLLTVLLLPPANLAVLALLALLLAGRRRVGRRAAALACAGLVLLALPVTGLALLASLAPGAMPPLSVPPEAIVILGGDVRRLDEAPGVALGPLSLERVRAGAALHRATGLPILVAGGIVDRTPTAVGTLMAQSLRDDFGVQARWTEAASNDTWENAERSAALLKADGIRSVHLVTHAWHMRRSLLSFSRVGLEAEAAAVRRDRWPDGVPSEFVPRASAWMDSYFGLHEWMGLLYYKVRP